MYDVKDCDLRVRTGEFALGIIRMCAALPKSTEERLLGGQVARSGTSVGANYREAGRACSKLEFIAQIGGCLKGLDKTACWRELLLESSVVPDTKRAALRDECDQLPAIFTVIPKKSEAAVSSVHISCLFLILAPEIP